MYYKCQIKPRIKSCYSFCLTTKGIISSARDINREKINASINRCFSGINYHLNNNCHWFIFSQLDLLIQFSNYGSIAIKTIFFSIKESLFLQFSLKAYQIKCSVECVPASSMRVRCSVQQELLFFLPSYPAGKYKEIMGVNQAMSHCRLKQCPWSSQTDDTNHSWRVQKAEQAFFYC